MDTWLKISMVFIGLIFFLILIVWLDWIYKCRKSAKDNRLKTYLVCYWLAKNEESKNEITIIDGILGLNANDLIYANRFQDEAMYMKQEISNIVQFDILHYNEKELLDFIYTDLDRTDKIRFTIRTMAGYSFSKRIPKFIKAQKLCKIRLADSEELYFSFKSTSKNDEIMNTIRAAIISL